MLNSNAHSSFIKQWLEVFTKNLNNGELNSFSKLNNDFDRFEFVFNLTATHEFNIKATGYNKDLPEARVLKEKGNSAFQSGDFKKALHFYNKSLFKSPLEKGTSYLYKYCTKTLDIFYF